MAFRYPPPPIGNIRSDQNPPSVPPVMNFSVPPPGFRPPCVKEVHQQDAYSFPPPPLPPLSLPPPPLKPPELQNFKQSVDHFIGVSATHPLKEESTLPKERPPDVTQLIQNFLEKRKSQPIKPYKRQPSSPPVKVFEARQMLQLCQKNLKKLFELQEDLKSNCDQCPILWKEKWDHIKRLRIQIDNCLEKLHNPATLDALRKILEKRNKKRRREKQKRVECKEMAAESCTRRQHLHESIDNWLKNMQDVVERAKREESLKLEADQVLSEVTRRKAEARRQLNMLKGLQKLRRIRAQTASNRGERLDTESGIRFTRVVEHLLKLWENQLKEYDVEEQGLRVMLEEAVEERTKSEVTQIKQTISQWESVLFGKRCPSNDFYQAAEKDVEAFIAVRKTWDQYLAPPGAVMSTSIPIGWVLPSNPSSEKWESLLLKDKQAL